MSGKIQMLRDGIPIYYRRFKTREEMKEVIKWYDAHFVKYHTHHIYELSIIFNV